MSIEEIFCHNRSQWLVIMGRLKSQLSFMEISVSLWPTNFLIMRNLLIKKQLCCNINWLGLCWNDVSEINCTFALFTSQAMCQNNYQCLWSWHPVGSRIFLVFWKFPSYVTWHLRYVVTYMPVMLVGAELDGLKNSLANKEKEMVEIDQVINQLNTKIHQVRLIQSQAIYILCPLCKIQLN